MKILLVQAYLDGRETPVYPLGLACIAASIPEHEITIFDPNIGELPYGRLREVIARCGPELVGVSLRNIDSTNKSEVVFYYQGLAELLQVIRSCCPAKIVLGGSGFSMFAQEIMENQPAVDFGVYLEGERVFPLLLRHLEEPAKVPSLYYRQDGHVRFSGPGHPLGGEQWPRPAWDRLPLAPYLQARAAIGVESKRGCALGCVYCIYGFLNGRRYRLKPPRRVVDEIEELARRHGVTRFTFVDSIFNVPLDQARAICRDLAGRGLPVTWSAWLNERFVDEEFLDLLLAAGCRQLIFSPDGFSDATLHRLGKQLSRREIVRSLLLVRRCGRQDVEVSYNFFKNPPGNSLANCLGMVAFCLWAKLLLRGRVHFEFSVLRIEPHTGLHRIALEEGVVNVSQSLLAPTYYTNCRTRHLERLLDGLLSLRLRRRHADV